MREVKFRAWDKNKKTMNYQKSDHPTFGNHAFDFGDLFYYAKNDLIPMQFIGSYDKHNKEIYEEDIVKVKSYGRFFYEKVTYVQFGYLPFRYIEEEFAIGGILPKECEVIGNVYENKELKGGCEDE